MPTTRSQQIWQCMCSDPDVCPAGYHLQNTCPKSGDKGKLVKASDPTPKPKNAKPAKKAAKKADAKKARAKKAPAKKAAAPKAKPKAPSQMSEAEIYDEMARLARRKAKLKAAQRKLEEEESESEEEEEEEE